MPHMLEQGNGYFLNVASAAGLLIIPDTVSYTVTKHAAVGFTEWLSTMYASHGIGVSLLTPAAVLTPILAGKEDTPQGQDAITTDQLVDIVMEGLAEERFLINTHPLVLEKFAVKGRDYEQYIGMLHADEAAVEAKAAAAV
jgi:short-subunit dehydrogenase